MTFYLLSKSGTIPNIRKKRIPLSSCCPKIEINVALSVFMHILHTPVLSLFVTTESWSCSRVPCWLSSWSCTSGGASHGWDGGNYKATLFLKVAQQISIEHLLCPWCCSAGWGMQGPGSPCWEFRPRAAMGSCLCDEPDQELQAPVLSQVRHSPAWLQAQWPPPDVASDCCPPAPLLHHLSWRQGLFQSF